jgi:ribonuclease HII
MKKLTLKAIESEIKEMELSAALDKLNHIKENDLAKVDSLLEKYSKKQSKMLAEIERFNQMSLYEKAAYKDGFNYIAGIDEVGRGPLAGPVVTCAVILPKDIFIEGLNDSKKVSAKKRDLLYNEIKEKAIAIGLGISDEKRIDEINILNSTKEAMRMAIDNLAKEPDLLLIDAEKLKI